MELEDIFVKNIPTINRSELFKKYFSYTNSLKEISKTNLKQWIDGSFVTKKSEPQDIDLVTFIDFSVVEALGNDLTDYKYPASQIIFGVDAYIVKTYPSDHKYYSSYLADKAYWMDFFNKTRRNRIGNKLAKGFLELNM
ncbi:MAG TPA: hypothetical protein VGN20_02470 [Mucilaginibacter sp.]|jgi:hypothetical protein